MAVLKDQYQGNYADQSEANGATNQSQFKALKNKVCKTMCKGAIGFASHWLKIGVRFLNQSRSVAIAIS